MPDGLGCNHSLGGGQCFLDRECDIIACFSFGVCAVQTHFERLLKILLATDFVRIFVVEYYIYHGIHRTKTGAYRLVIAAFNQHRCAIVGTRDRAQTIVLVNRIANIAMCGHRNILFSFLYLIKLEKTGNLKNK